MFLPGVMQHSAATVVCMAADLFMSAHCSAGTQQQERLKMGLT